MKNFLLANMRWHFKYVYENLLENTLKSPKIFAKIFILSKLTNVEKTVNYIMIDHNNRVQKIEHYIFL